MQQWRRVHRRDRGAVVEVLLGRRVSRRQLAKVRWTVEKTAHKIRSDLARTFRLLLNWRNHRSDDNVKACLATREQPAKPVWRPESDPQPAFNLPLFELDGVRPLPVESRQDRRLWYSLFDRCRYLYWRNPFGSRIRYFTRDDSGRWIGCLQSEDCT